MIAAAPPLGLLTCPPVLAAADFRLRGQRNDDYSFLERLYASVREDEIGPLGWDADEKSRFLASQFALQHRHYAEHYRQSEFAILERAGSPVGRLYLYRRADDHRIVDISLVPEIRNRGIGRALLEAVMLEASARGRSVSIHVEKFNPAQRLYQRLGFRVAGESGPYWLMQWRS